VKGDCCIDDQIIAMKMPKYWKIFFVLLAIFCMVSFTSAAKKSKWQILLEKNNIPIVYWQKYLPSVNRGEYRNAVKAYQDSSDGGNNNSDNSNNNSDDEVKIIDGKYSLPDDSGKIALEQHLWLKDNQSASSHYKMTNTPSSCQNGMAGGYGAFGTLNKDDKNEEKYYVTMRWGYADWVEPASDIDENVGKDEKTITLQSGDDFAKSGFLKIGDEYIKYTSRSGDKLKGLKRGYKSSVSTHNNGDSAKQTYRYKGGRWERVTRVVHVDTGKKDWFKEKKVLVTNERNGKKVVASILESGPAIWTNRVGGLSPEAFSAIDAKNNEKCDFQYVDGDTKLGEVK
jgi:hypothetical protein